MPGLPLPTKESTHSSDCPPDHKPLPPTKKTAARELDAADDGQIAHFTDTKRLAIPDCPIPLQRVLTSGKGRGMIATQDIKRGTRIISEEAILHLEGTNDRHLLEKLLHLSQSQHERLTDLSDRKGMISPELCATVASELEKNHQYSGRYLKAAARDFAKLHTIFYANAVMMGPEARFGVGIFPTYSYLNHSCTPNVQHSYNATIGREVVHAIRDIQAGEEVLTSYIPLQQTEMPRKQDLYQQWAFECQCNTCVGKNVMDSEIRRRRLWEIDQGFAFLDKQVNKRTFEEILKRGLIPKTERESLSWAEESVGLLKAEGLVGMDMAKAYRKCSKCSVQEGQLEKALGYAWQELELQVVCLGKDTAYLAPDEDANAWIKHVESMSKADKVRMRMNEMRVTKEQKKENKKAAKKAARR